LQHPDAVAISARSGSGVPELLTALGNALRPVRDFVELVIPHEAAGAVSRLHEVGQIVEREYGGTAARFKVRIPPHVRAEFAPYLTGNA
jgi:GTP-binding protein HflX